MVDMPLSILQFSAELRKKLKQKRVPGRQKRATGPLTKKRTGSRSTLPRKATFL